MLLTKNHIKGFSLFYLACYLINYGWNLFHSLSFTAISPLFFIHNPDVSLQLILATPLLSFLLQNPAARILFDLLAFLLPVILVICVLQEKKVTRVVAIITALFSLLYYILLSSISFYSSEVFVCWMVIPLLFTSRKVEGFYYWNQMVRLFFALIFFSSALWKLKTGALFQPQQMSAILLEQHLAGLQYQGHDIFSKTIFYLIGHPSFSRLLYVGSFVIELSFMLAFFTTRFDKVLMILLALFIVSDFFLMGINYYPWISFIGCLYLSRYGLVKPPIKRTGY